MCQLTLTLDALIFAESLAKYAIILRYPESTLNNVNMI